MGVIEVLQAEFSRFKLVNARQNSDGTYTIEAIAESFNGWRWWNYLPNFTSAEFKFRFQVKRVKVWKGRIYIHLKERARD